MKCRCFVNTAEQKEESDLWPRRLEAVDIIPHGGETGEMKKALPSDSVTRASRPDSN